MGHNSRCYSIVGKPSSAIFIPGRVELDYFGGILCSWPSLVRSMKLSQLDMINDSLYSYRLLDLDVHVFVWNSVPIHCTNYKSLLGHGHMGCGLIIKSPTLVVS